MPATSIEFLGGVREIGGNKILITDGPDRILFDFGPSFSPLYEAFYVDFLQPRSTSPVKDLLEFDLLPRIPGLYSKEALTDSDLPYEEPSVHGVFVSHAHADHAGYLNLIDPKIPVYTGRGTKLLLDAIAASGSRDYGPHDWQVVADRHPVKVGGIEVVPFPVDHSIPWAYGFLVRTSHGTIVYTGDFRSHGPRSDDTHSFFSAAAEEEPMALVIEGTRAGPDSRRNLSEAGVRTEVDRVLEDTKELALVCTYPRDIDRLTTLYAAARAVDREFIVSLRTAYLLQSIAPEFPDSHLPVPGRSPGVRAYGRKKRRYYRWEAPLLESAVNAEYVRAHGGSMLLALDLAHFAELIDLRPPKGSPFIHSMSEPFSEDDVDDRVFHKWLDHFGLRFHQMHASGHASGPELLSAISAVHPATVFPVHTEHPEGFDPASAPVLAPEKGIRYPLPTPRGHAR